MSRQPWEAFGGEQITVTSGIDPGLEITLRNNAWVVMETRGLSIPQVLIENRIIPGEVGTVELPGAENELRTSLPFQMTGDYPPDGDQFADPRVGLRRNWIYLFWGSNQAGVDKVFDTGLDWLKICHAWHLKYQFSPNCNVSSWLNLHTISALQKYNLGSAQTVTENECVVEFF